MLQRRFGQAAVARLAQPKRAHALRHRALDALPLGVEGAVFVRAFPCSRRHEHFVFAPGIERQIAAPSGRRARAARPRRTGLAVVRMETHLYQGTPVRPLAVAVARREHAKLWGSRAGPRAALSAHPHFESAKSTRLHQHPITLYALSGGGGRTLDRSGGQGGRGLRWCGGQVQVRPSLGGYVVHRLYDLRALGAEKDVLGLADHAGPGVVDGRIFREDGAFLGREGGAGAMEAGGSVEFGLRGSRLWARDGGHSGFFFQEDVRGQARCSRRVGCSGRYKGWGRALSQRSPPPERTRTPTPQSDAPTLWRRAWPTCLGPSSACSVWLFM